MKMYASPALESNVDILFVFANVSWHTYCQVMFVDDFLTLICILTYIHVKTSQKSPICIFLFQKSCPYRSQRSTKKKRFLEFRFAKPWNFFRIFTEQISPTMMATLWTIRCMVLTVQEPLQHKATIALASQE